MTADDVVFSINRALTSKYNTVMTACFKEAVKIDDSTAELHLKYAYSPADKCLATVQMSILPKKVVEANPEGFARNPVATGPYKFVSWSSGDKIVLEAFDDYYRGAPVIKDVTFVNIADHSTAFIALEKGEIDLMINPNMSDRQSIVDNPELIYHESPAAAYQLFTFNNEKGRFTEKKLRQAVSYAIDREAILVGAREGQGLTVEAAMLPILAEFPVDFKSDPYDPEKAKQLVIEAGYPDGLTVKVPTIDAATYIKPTTMLQEMLRPIGINIEIEIMERGAWNQRVLVDTDYEMCMWAVPISVLDADFAAFGPFHSANRGGNGKHMGKNADQQRPHSEHRFQHRAFISEF
jgi:peptide/nickel transport system substrate-binding protein